MTQHIHFTGFLPPLSATLPSRIDRERDQAQRMAISHEIYRVADEVQMGDDMRPHYDDHERLSRLFAAIGDVTTDILDNASMGLPAALVRLVAEGQLWLEAHERERAAA